MPSAWLPTPPASSPVLLQWFSSEPDPIALSWSRYHTLRRAASVCSVYTKLLMFPHSLKLHLLKPGDF